VNTDGLISLGAAINSQYSPRPLPLSSPSTPFIAVYWADVDTGRNDGRIYYRLTTGNNNNNNNTAIYIAQIRAQQQMGCRVISVQTERLSA